MSWEQKTKPAIYGEPMKRRSVRLDDDTVTKAQQLGDGNLSAGLRRAVELAIGGTRSRCEPNGE